MIRLCLILLVLLCAAGAWCARKPFDPDSVTYSNIRDCVYTNAEIVKKPVRGIFVNFHGAGYNDTRDEDSPSARAFAEAGVVEIFPYGTKNCWMKASLAREVRYYIDVIRREHHIPDTVPMAFGGCSMGGFAALTFGIFSGIKPVCIAANCPVTVPMDWVDFQHPGLEPDALEGILLPISVLKRLPKTDYLFLSGVNDPIPGLADNTARLAEGLRARGLRADLYEGPIGHCGATEEMTEAYTRFIFEHFGLDTPGNTYGCWY